VIDYKLHIVADYAALGSEGKETMCDLHHSDIESFRNITKWWGLNWAVTTKGT
jgi:hypothetical protein